MSYSQHTADVPSSIALPSDPEDQSPDYDVTVVFDWAPGNPPSGLSGPPENYDPGDGDDFVIITSGEIAGDDLPDHIVEQLIEWLDENWDRPEPDYGPEDDDHDPFEEVPDNVE